MQQPRRPQAGHFQPYGALPVPKVTPEMRGLIKDGTVYSLGVVYAPDMPVFEGMVPYTRKPRIRHGQTPDIAPVSGVVGTVSYEITVSDVQETMRWQGGTTVTPGTAVLIRTGYYNHFDERDTAAFNQDIAG